MNPYLRQIQDLALPNKYTRWYINIIENALLRPQNRLRLKETYGYVESHHILPKSFHLGGEKDKNNLVFLTAKEHFVIHLVATKMFDSYFKNKMAFAFWRLNTSNTNQSRHTNSRLYAKIKPDFHENVRLYKGLKVKYVSKNNPEGINELKLQGWSETMTPEFKARNTGNMKGKRHSDETKRKMSAASKGKPKHWLRGTKRSEETKQKAKESRIQADVNDPERKKRRLENTSKRTKELFASGKLNVSGENNPRFGAVLSDETKEKISIKAKDRFKKLKSDSVAWKAYLEKRKKTAKETWKDPERRVKASVYSSKAFQQLGVTAKEYYDQKIKPLLYMGFLPKAISQYIISDRHKQTITSMIKKFGTEEDISQFELNKKRGAGANHKYITFQKEQAERISCGESPVDFID